jgi:hypothetical protein
MMRGNRPLQVGRYAVPLALMLALALTVNGQQVTSNDQQSAESGSLTGIVVGENGQPLNATVLVRRINSFGPPRVLTTNNDGKFEFSNLDRALYSVTASAPAYVMPSRDPDTPPPQYRVGDSPRLELIRGGVITGTVTNASNEPVVAVRVRALMVRDAKDQELKSLPSFGQTTTDDRGIYRIFGLVPGTYIVEAGGHSNITNIVSPYDLDTPTFAPSSGRDSATEVTVSPGIEASVDIRYRGERGHIISGTIKKLGPTGVSVALTSAKNGWMPVSTAILNPGSRGFEFLGVADGVYDVTAQETMPIPGSLFGELALSESRRITVKGTDIIGIELATKPLGSISGKLILQPSAVPECAGKRRPVFAETLITVLRNRKDTGPEPAAFVRPTSIVASPDKNGELLWRNLVDGDYSFVPRFFARYWYLQSITMPVLAVSGSRTTVANQKTDASRKWTTIKSAARITGLTITLSEGAASLRGKLDVPEGTKLPDDLRLYLIPAEKEKADDVLRYFVEAVGADGAFSAENLPPGRYWLLTQPRSGSERLTTLKLQLPDAIESRMKLRKTAETTKTEIELKPCQNLTDHRLRFDP